MPDDAAILKNLVRRMKARGSDPLRPLLDAYLIERGRANVRHTVAQFDMTPRPRRGGRFSPSDLCGCERAAAFKFVGVPGRRRVDPDQELVFDDGNWRHVKWQATFHDMEAVLGSERFRVISTERNVRVDEYCIAGSLDNVLWLQPSARPGKKWVVDIKGINDAGFNYVLREDAPIPHHVKQLVSYERAVGIPRGLLWYEDKNNQHTKAFIVRYDDDAWHEVTGWCTSVLSYLERGILPPMDEGCTHGTFLFEKCAYAALCYGGQSVEQLRRLAYDSFDGVQTVWRRSVESE